MPGERGEYRPFFCRLLNGPSFKALKADARSCLYPIKLRLPAAGIGVIPGLVATLVEDTGLTGRRVKAALTGLESAGWVRIEGSVVWLVRGLEFEPTLNTENKLHRSHIQNVVKALPSLRIVEDFKRHYAPWFGEPSYKETGAPPEASESHSQGPRSTTPTPSPSPTPKTTTASRRVDNSNNRGEKEPSPLDQVAGAVRTHWWAPDGKPPDGWDMGRELSIWKAEFKDGLSLENGLKAIEGLRALADSSRIDWLKKGDKLTGRALFHSHNGALRMYPQAINAYFSAGEQKRPPRGRQRPPGGPTEIDELAQGAARRVAAAGGGV